MLPVPDDTWTTKALLDRVVADARSEAAGEDAYWATIYLLQKRDPDGVWQLVAPLAHHEDAAHRSLVPDVLRFLGGRKLPRRAQTLELFREMLRAEQSTRVLIAIATAFVDLADAAAVELLTPLVTHPDADVRSAVVHGLLPVARRVVPQLIALSRDPADHVRDWATFGLGSQTDVDTPELRDALAARLEDEHEDTRAEATVGLALRKDLRALPNVRRELEGDSVGILYTEAAKALGDESLYEPLQALAADNPDSPDIAAAVLACRPRD